MINKWMKKISVWGGLFMLSALLSACSNQVNIYKDFQPQLSLENFLNGHIVGTGFIEDWRGRVTRQFDFQGEASWNNGICTFEEQMNYYDGKSDHRTWVIKKINDHYYEGKTEEVIGIAKIFINGNAMNWQYKMDVKVDNSTYRLSFDDWMYLMNNDVLINKNSFKKFGLKVGSLTLVMNKKIAST
jgi:hypothetical protein